jgi:hypothetical protein
MTRLAKYVAVLALPIALAGCAGKGVLPLGGSSFYISEPVGGCGIGGNCSYPDAMEIALLKANKHCSNLNKRFLVTKKDAAYMAYVIEFSCLLDGDPQLLGQKAPDVVIENRNR